MTNITVHRIHLNRGPQVKIGEVVFRHAQLCDRCDFTQVFSQKYIVDFSIYFAPPCQAESCVIVVILPRFNSKWISQYFWSLANPMIGHHLYSLYPQMELLEPEELKIFCIEKLTGSFDENESTG